MRDLGSDWATEAKDTITGIKRYLTSLSVATRTDQYRYLERFFGVSAKKRVLDVGTTSDETLKDSNLFLRLYPYSKKLITATVEDEKKLQKMYPGIKVVKVYPKKRLPFKDGEFDLVTAWAVLEHVGGYKDQEFFINELLRVGKQVFLTTPYRACPYEPHTGWWFAHWLPVSLFRLLTRRYGQAFWADEDHLNPLFVMDIKKMRLSRVVGVDVYRLFGILPSHLIIHG